MKLAVYGTLRAGSNKTGVIKNSSLSIPRVMKAFPAVIQNKNKKWLWNCSRST